MLLKQTWFSAGRGSNSGPNEANRSAASHQSRWLRLQNPKQLLSDVFQHESFDTPDTPNTWAPDLGGFIALKPRQGDNLNINVSTCGYLNGDASKPRTADSGFDCRVDTKNAIWGFCPTTILAVSNCGLVGGCVDAHACDSGCGISGDPTVTTFTCTTSGADYCSTALLNDGPDQTYSYIACGTAAITDNLLFSPTTTSLLSSTSRTSALSKAKPSVTSASSTSSATTSSINSVISSTPTSSSPIPITPILSSAPPSSSTLSKATPSPSNNTGAIVGGVLGGLALLAFVVAVILFHRRLKTSPTSGDQDHDPAWQDTGYQRRMSKEAPGRWLPLAELPSHGPLAELSSGRYYESTELPDDRRD